MPMPQHNEIGPAKGRARRIGRVVGVAFLFALGAGLMAVGVFSGSHTGPHNYVARGIVFMIGFITIASAWDALVGK